MDAKQAIAKLKKLDAEEAADLASVLEKRLGELEADKFAEINKAQTAMSKLASLEAALVGAGKAIGLDGDAEALLPAIEPKVRELTASLSTTQAKLTEEQSARTNAETRVAAFERQVKLSELANKSGAQVAVLERLFGNELDKFAIDGDAVKFNGQPLRDVVESDQTLKAFLPALFPVTEIPVDAAPEPTLPRLPGTAPTPTVPTPDPALSSYADRYNAVNALLAGKQ